MSAASPDAELIRICHQFAETAFRNWYLYVIRPSEGPGSADELDVDDDWDTLARIENTPAITPNGFVAKALACAAWARTTYDAMPDDCDGHTRVLSSLLRDMAAPARRKILAALEAELGPLPDGYDSEWRWIGRSAPDVVQQMAGQGVHPDTDLLQACADYHVAFNKTRHLDPDVNDPNGPVWNAASDAWTDAMRRVTAAKPKTIEGLRAKALVVATEVYDVSVTYHTHTIDDAQHHERLAYSLAQDVLGWAT